MNHRHADLDAAWQFYVDHVIPDDASSVQVEATSRAFYAGAAVILGFIMDWSGMKLSAKDGGAALDSLNTQVAAFVEAIPRCDDPECEACRPEIH